MSKIEVRKLPKKTIVLIVVLSSIGIIGFLIMQDLKNQKAYEMISDLGYKNISEVKFINKLQAEDKKTKHKVNLYKVKFYDNSQNKTCIGFIQKLSNKKYIKDIDCK